jgi:hypothetical protein
MIPEGHTYNCRCIIPRAVDILADDEARRQEVQKWLADWEAKCDLICAGLSYTEPEWRIYAYVLLQTSLTWLMLYWLLFRGGF